MNGDITLEALFKQFFYIYICCFIIVVQMSTAGVFWSRNLCLSAIMLFVRNFAVIRQ